VAATLPVIALLCRRAGGTTLDGALVATLSLAMLPISSLALQVDPETAACLAVAAALALLVTATPSRLRAGLAGASAGHLVFLHVRFLPLGVVLLGFGVWRLGDRRALAFAAGWFAAASLQVWYVYHATGLPWPTAFYEAAAISALGPRAIAVNMLRFAVDRDW